MTTQADPTNDTSPAAAAAHLDALRRMGPSGRLRAGLRFSRSMISLTRAAIRQRHPEADEQTLMLLWIEHAYGEELADAVARQLGAVEWVNKTTSS